MSYSAVLMDFETLGHRPDSVVLDLAAVVFNIEELDDFNQLIKDPERIFSVKFDVEEQIKNYQRTIDKDTLTWWTKQGGLAKHTLVPSESDISLLAGMEEFKTFLTETGIYPSGNTLCYVRGPSFDFPILVDIGYQIWKDFDQSSFPVKFFNQRDVRTAMSHDLSTPNNTRCPMPLDSFKGYVKHNSIHDCARDVISLQTSWRYKTGELELPDQYELY